MFKVFKAKYVFYHDLKKTIYNHSITNENNTAALGYFYAHFNSQMHVQFWLR